ncbi:MAG: hypothetical protein RL088_4247 [Verrucomicrobiota bacterium]|jgi:uncharacterized membrane protein YdjX (TVP38/TMEM64 family)
MRLLRIFLILTALVLIPFFIWGGKLMALFDGELARQWILSWGRLGGVAVLVLLVADLFLPIPATGVMSAAGFVYGPVAGGLLGVCGSFMSGMLAYALCRAFGRGAAERLAGEEGLAENEALFRRGGPWLVALSRWLPVFPEVVACLAGLARMELRVFATALLCGTLPMGFTYAAVGALFSTEPGWAFGLSVALPVVLWLAFRPLLKRKDAGHGGPQR